MNKQKDSSGATPGPWTWEPCEVEDGQPIAGARLEHNGKSIFTVDCGDYFGLNDANARRIVRRVNSHDELVALAEAVVKHFADTDAPLGQQARIAIAKAKGAA